ncbi:galactoside ABC transporter permease [Lachnospiraceae bacterium KGMB03038]|nr:galactoside ABC transporter permease [Lachnospiraceae bacterium KGMB03038]
MANGNSKVLTAEQELKLRQPIDEHVGEIQAKINSLREDGTDQVVSLQNKIDGIKRDKSRTKSERESAIAKIQKELETAKAVEAKNKDEISKLISKAEAYLKEHFDKDYYEPVKASCEAEKAEAKAAYQKRLAELEKEHKETVAKLSDHQEIKDENYVYKNRQFDAKVELEQNLQQIKDRRHAAYSYKYHLIDMLRMSKFTFLETSAQKWENYKYTFNRRAFLLQNGLYIAIILIFVALCIITPMVKGSPLLTYNNVLNILQQASPRMFLALGVAGLILLAGTDLSVGRMVGMGMTTATIIMHQGVNTGGVFGHIFDFTGMSIGGRMILALVMCILLCTFFTTLAGFFTAKFKMHPFISTMANMLMIFGLVTYATKGVSFGAIEPSIPAIIIPKVNGFPTIILWAVAAIVIVWFIWNKTTFGKNLYAVGGNAEAAAVSGISVFAVTVGAFVLAGILYGFGSWLECARMVGSGSAAYGQGWETDAIAACVVGGVSFTGGIGKISGVVVGVLIFTALTYSLTILGIDTNLQFVFSGIIILVAVTLDCLKYVQKK